MEMILIRVAFLVAATYAAKQIGFHYWNSSSWSSDTTKESFKQHYDHEERENVKSKKEEEENEVEYLRCEVHNMEETQETTERKLLLYYGWKQQEMGILEVNKDLKMKTVEIDKLSNTIKALKFENKKLQEEFKEHDLQKKQLHGARVKIKELEKRIQSNEYTRINQVKMIEEQVASIQADADHKKEADIQKREELDREAMYLKRRQKELQLEKRVLAIKLVVAEARITSISNVAESEVNNKIRMEADALRTANNELLKDVEGLQVNRFNVVEELVYQRWVNACLRHEIQNHQTPSRKNSTSTRRSVSLRQLLTPSKEFCNATKDDSSSGKTRVGQKTSLIHKFKRWRRSMDDYRSFGSSSRGTTSSESSMSRRSSISLEGSVFRKVPDRMAAIVEKKTTICSPEKANVPQRRRRVSFNDSLNTVRHMSTAVDITDDMRVAYRDPGKIVAKLEKPNEKKASELKTADSLHERSNITSSFKTPAEKSGKGEEPITPQLIPTSTVVCEPKPADHIEESARRIALSSDSNTNDVQSKVFQFERVFTFFLVLILLYFWVRNFLTF